MTVFVVCEDLFSFSLICIIVLIKEFIQRILLLLYSQIYLYCCVLTATRPNTFIFIYYYYYFFMGRRVPFFKS